ncbi:MAG: phytoene desaturase family protein [Actinomycetota bacterium]
MNEERNYDAVVVGAGPNGLAAAIELARAGKSVVVYEAANTPGGGCRSAELTLPGIVHDICSAIHPLALASPFFKSIPLAELGVRFRHPDSPLAHPLDDGDAAVLERTVAETAEGLGGDAHAYTRLMKPLARNIDKLIVDILGPLRIPHHPIALARFGLPAVRSAHGLANARFKEPRARALFAGIAAHSMLSLRRPPTAAYGLMLGAVGHGYGWPTIEGGSQKLTDALVACLAGLGGRIVTDHRIETLGELPRARAILFDLTPRQVVAIAGDELPARYRRRLERYQYGPGVFKIDFALSEPIPWKADVCRRAGTVHLGGTLEEVTAAEDAVCRGRHPDRPYALVAQQTTFDETRAPDGKHTAWAYCHVPSGSPVDMTDRIVAQIERFAPGFRDTVVAQSTMTAPALEAYNANYIGGDISGGVQHFGQLFTRPAVRFDPYSTPNKRLYFCSSSTPPGGGVHGMCGYYAARSALGRAF